MESYLPTDRTTLKRRAGRGAYDRAVVHAILDEALICHVGFVGDGGQPFVIPTAFVRVGETLYLHGAPASRIVKGGMAGAKLCVTVTLLDGLVLARSAFHHSMNYRSVVVLGEGQPVTDPVEKRSCLDALVARMAEGRERSARAPTDAELAATGVVSLPLVEVSAKVRSGPPIDDEGDLGHPVWAGVVPLSLAASAPEPDGEERFERPRLPRVLARTPGPR
jgi:nitroimidazol reductase NimA-like FMN-containing flavoprotein (pyridoxamine 5'-phosphate oxidase superfamily)